MNVVMSLHAWEVFPALISASTACAWLSKLFWAPCGKLKLLIVAIIWLTWFAAPLTTTWKFALTGLLVSSLSVAVQVTVVVPMAKVLPEAGVQDTAGPGLSPLSSVAVGGV